MTERPASENASPDATPGDDDVTARKAAMRREVSAARKAAHAEKGVRAAAEVSLRVLGTIDPPKGSTVSAFLSIGTELDTEPLMHGLWARGCRVALPCVAAQRAPLVFRVYNHGDALVEESFGTRAPAPEAREVEPDILIVPLLAFDRAGYRLGYGGGFYDRTLADLRARRSALAVGVGFAAQEVDAVPHDADDQQLDWIVTEAGAFRP